MSLPPNSAPLAALASLPRSLPPADLDLLRRPSLAPTYRTVLSFHPTFLLLGTLIRSTEFSTWRPTKNYIGVCVTCNCNTPCFLGNSPRCLHFCGVVHLERGWQDWTPNKSPGLRGIGLYMAIGEASSSSAATAAAGGAAGGERSPHGVANANLRPDREQEQEAPARGGGRAPVQQQQRQVADWMSFLPDETRANAHLLIIWPALEVGEDETTAE